MKTALIGLANTGKTTLFNALTELNIPITPYHSTAANPHIGIVKVPDKRVEELSRIFNPKKTAYATIEYIDFFGLTKGDISQNRKVIDLIKDADSLVHVIRAFEDETIVHPLGSINPTRDFEVVETELILSDLELVEKRLQRMDDNLKKGKKPDESEKKVLLKCRELLEDEIPLRYVRFEETEQKAIQHLQFISILPLVVVVNIPESGLKNNKKMEQLKNDLNKKVMKHAVGRKSFPVFLSCKLEMEIAQLLPEEAVEFLRDLGIQEPAKGRLIKESYSLLGLVSFLTVGEDEVRAWTIKEGTSALKAAGKVHSDIERGFIRAEVISFDDFTQSGSMSVAKQHGLVRLEGKTYTVCDGDIINFRFNV